MASSPSFGSCVPTWALARAAPHVYLCLAVSLADPDPLTGLPSFTSHLLVSSHLPREQGFWLTPLATTGPVLDFFVWALRERAIAGVVAPLPAALSPSAPGSPTLAAARPLKSARL